MAQECSPRLTRRVRDAAGHMLTCMAAAMVAVPLVFSFMMHLRQTAKEEEQKKELAQAKQKQDQLAEDNLKAAEARPVAAINHRAICRC